MSHENEERFPAEALQALDYPEVLEWIAASAHTPPGKRSVLASHPAMDRARLGERRALGAEAAQALEAGCSPSLARGGDLATTAETAGRRSLGGRELLAVREGLECAQGLQRWSHDHPEFPALGALIRGFPDCHELLEELRRTLDARGEVRDEAHPDLGRLRERVRDLITERSRTMERISEDWNRRGVLRQRKPLLRSGRLLLAVRSGHQGRISGVLHETSQSGDTLFMEPGEVLALSNRLTEAERREAQLVQRLLGELSRRVYRTRGALEETARRVGEVDAAAAAAAWAQENEALYPAMETTGGTVGDFDIRSARHPLLQRQLGRDQVVPLTLTLGADWDLLVVTGPNTGGKTVVLKTVGLLAAMARAGFPVTTVEGSRFAVIPGLDADIGDSQSLESSLSTFSGHLRRVLRILRQALGGSLVLLDELGTGTDPEEGAALGKAVLETLVARQCRILASTHIGALKLFSLDLERAENASMEFDPATLAPQFRLLVGVPGASHALEVAESLGLPPAVLARARELARREGEEKLLAKVSDLRRDAELLREKARDNEAAVRESLRRQEEEEQSAAYLRELREREAEEAYRALCGDLQSMLDEDGGRLLHRLRGTDREQADELMRALAARLTTSDLGSRWEEFLRSLRKGDVVYVPRFLERVKILKVDRKRDRVKVQRGSLEIELPMREITWVAPPPGGDLRRS